MNESFEETRFELDRFELVLRKRPQGSSPISDAEAERLQELPLLHLEEQTRLANIRVAGPFDGQIDQSLRGLCIYRTGSLEKARELASTDPSVVAGRLALDLTYFYGPKGSI